MVQLATKTLEAFNAALTADQGNAFRHWLGRVVPHIGDAYRQDSDAFRSHMGASTIGRECARELWYSFRWATAKRFDGRMLRLFNRGHMEEARFIALLLTIGCAVIQQDENGRQFRIEEFGGHYGGSGDGMADGIPDLPAGVRALTEFKTHNDKSFKKLKEAGVREAKFEHFVQMQQYMRKMGLVVAVYFAVNKNDDELYAEIVPLDVNIADRYIHRAIEIIPLQQPPNKLSQSAGWFGCKFCDHRPVCHLGAPPERNCRTCEHSVPRPDGKWWCENRERQTLMLFEADRAARPDVCDDSERDYSLSKRRQLSGCGMWSKNRAAFA